MLVYKPSPARLASVSVQFPHGAPFCRSTVVKTVSSSGRHASSSLAHAQTWSGFCSRQEGLDPPVCFTGRLLLEQHNPWEGGLECGHCRQGVFGQHTVLVACAPVPAARKPSSPGPCEWQWAAQVTVEGSSGHCGHHATQVASHRAAGTGGTGSIQPGQVLVHGWMRGRTRECTRARVALEESRPSSV